MNNSGDIASAGSDRRSDPSAPGVVLRGAGIRLDDISVRFGGFTAASHISLEIAAGEFFSILGPSGCGKTTLLRLLSGFLEPSEGRVFIGGEDMAGRGPNARPTALIFQNLALFPLMSVRENVAFGLEARGVGKRRRLQRADELLSLVALDGHGDKKPGELSGGQRQRVAIARALAVEPAVLLLDEPLSALDLKLRQHMRAELKAIQRKTGVTFVYITHDQGEALTMSDRIAVMNRGRISQIGSPLDIYERPATRFVASFVGKANILPATRSDDARAIVWGASIPAAPAFADAQFDVFVRPQRMRLVSQAEPIAPDMARVVGRIARSVFVGDHIEVIVEGEDGARLTVDMQSGQAPPPDGAEIAAIWRAQDTLPFQREAA